MNNNYVLTPSNFENKLKELLKENLSSLYIDGIIDTLVKIYNMRENDVLSLIIQNLPERFNISYLPLKKLGIHDNVVYGHNIPFYELWETLPEEERTDEVRKKLIDRYFYVLIMASRFFKEPTDGKKFRFMPFMKPSQTSIQHIAYFSVEDTNRNREEKYNWHGNNISQVIFNGAIVVSKGLVSMHT